MADLLPTTADASAAEEADPRVIGLDSDDAGELIDALSSSTARQLLAELHEDPATPSEVSDRVDTSLQNAQYHLGNLEDAGAIEVVDTAYSEKGREMNVYAPADAPLVVFAGDDEKASGLRRALARLIGGVSVLAVGSGIVQYLAEEGFLGGGASTGTTDGPSIMGEPTTSTAVTGGGPPPGLLFFAGGLIVLLAAFAAWYLQN